MSELEQELISLKQAAATYPADVSYSSLLRWYRTGLPCPNGERLYLEGRRIGEKIFTTRQWLDRFIEERTRYDVAERDERMEPPLPIRPRRRRTTKERERAVERSIAYLEQHGIRCRPDKGGG